MRTPAALLLISACMASPADPVDEAPIDEPADTDLAATGTFPTEVCAREAPGFQENDCAPAPTLPDAQGQDVALADLAGSVVVLDFSAIWCSTCRRLAPALEALHAEDRDGLQVLTILYQNQEGDPPTRDDLVLWRDTYDVEHTLLADDGSERDRWGGVERPLVIVVGRDGRIAARLGGSAEALRDAVDAALAD